MKYFLMAIMLILVALVKFHKSTKIKRNSAISLAVILSGIMFYSWLITSPPEQASLKSISGVIVYSQPRNSHTSDRVFQLNTSSIKFSYIDWYPNFRQVVGTAKVGDRVVFWFDPDGSDEKQSIWMINKNGIYIVSYSEMRAEREKNRWVAIILGIFFLFSAGYIFYKKSYFDKA